MCIRDRAKGEACVNKLIQFTLNNKLVTIVKKSACSWACSNEFKSSNLSAENLKKRNLNESTLELKIWWCDTDQRIPCFDSCQLATTWLQAPKFAIKNVTFDLELFSLWCGRTDERMSDRADLWSRDLEMRLRSRTREWRASELSRDKPLSVNEKRWTSFFLANRTHALVV